MEQIVFSDEELAEMKQRIMARAEERIEKELVEEVRRSVSRTAFTHAKDELTRKVGEIIAASFTQERVEKLLADALEDQKSKRWGQSAIEKELHNAITRVVNAHAEAVSETLKNLLYVRLKDDFYEKEKTDG